TTNHNSSGGSENEKRIGSGVSGISVCRSRRRMASLAILCSSLGVCAAPSPILITSAVTANPIIALVAIRSGREAASQLLLIARGGARRKAAPPIRGSVRDGPHRRCGGGLEISARLEGMPVNPGGGSSEELRGMIDADIEKYVAAVKTANLKFEG